MLNEHLNYLNCIDYGTYWSQAEEITMASIEMNIELTKKGWGVCMN